MLDFGMVPRGTFKQLCRELIDACQMSKGMHFIAMVKSTGGFFNGRHRITNLKGGLGREDICPSSSPGVGWTSAEFFQFIEFFSHFLWSPKCEKHFGSA